MKIYFILMFVTLILQFVLPAKNKKGYLRKCLLSFIPFFIYAAIRVNFGPDYASYEQFFDYIHNSSIKNYDTSNEHMEVGFAFLNTIIPSFRTLLVLDSLLVASTFVFVFYKYIPPKYGWLGIALLFLTGNNSIFFELVAMRNGIVVCMLMLSLPLIINRDWKKLVPVTALAWTIHSSAALFFPLAYIVSNSNPINKKRVWLWIGILLVFLLSSTSGIIDQITPIVLMVNDGYEGVLQEISNPNQSTGVIASAFSLILSFLILYGHYHDRDKFSKSENVIICISLLFALSYLLGALNTRVSQYFVLPFIVTVTIIANKTSKEVYKYTLIGITLVYTIYSFYYVWVLNNPYFVYQQYRSIWD